MKLRLFSVATALVLGCGDGTLEVAQPGAAGAPSTGSAVSAAGTSGASGAAGIGVMPAAGAAGRGVVAAMGSAGAGEIKGGAGQASAGVGGTASAVAGVGGVSGASAGAGGAESGGAAGHSDGAATDDPCGADAQVMTGMTREQGSGETNLQTSGNVEILSVHTIMKVPSKPAPTQGTLFLWPGLQPLQMDMTVGYGVLQPVLAWGTSCAPGTVKTYDTWWISGQYVGTTPGSWTNVSCEGGDVMKVEVGDELDIDMTLNGTVWTQVITNKSNGKSVNFMRDLKGQKEQWLINSIELKGSTKPVDDVIFTKLVIKLSDSQPKACVPNVKGTTDYFAPPRVSSDGKTCCISKLILRASGVKPSSPDEP
jgi:hypothetical protein